MLLSTLHDSSVDSVVLTKALLTHTHTHTYIYESAIQATVPTVLKVYGPA